MMPEFTGQRNLRDKRHISIADDNDFNRCQQCRHLGLLGGHMRVEMKASRYGAESEKRRKGPVIINATGVTSVETQFIAVLSCR